MHLTKLLNICYEDKAYISILSARINTSKSKTNTNILNFEKNPLNILVAKYIFEVNIEYKTYFIFLTQFNIENRKVYNKTMSRIYILQKLQIIKKELNQLKKKNI